MEKRKIKLIAILASLILAGGLLPGAIRVIADSGAAQAEDLPGLSEQEKTQEIQPEPQAENELSSPLSGYEFFYKMLLSISLVITLGIAVIYISKKLLPRLTNAQGKQICVIETAHIAPRKGIHLIQVGSKRLLVASTNENISMLADVTDSVMDFATELEARS